MATLSRVKKYEELRKSIEVEQINQDSNQEESEDTITDPKELLKAFDSSVFKKSEIQEEDSKAKRAKEVSSDDSYEERHDDEDRFTNEYLDDFMKEVREYNIKKGNREYDDTEVDILYQLSPSNSKKRARYVQEIKSDDTEVAKSEVIEQEEENKSDIISSQVESLLDDSEENNGDTNELENELANYESNITNIHNELRKEVEETIEQVKLQNQDHHEKLLDETKQMKKQLDSYESELNDLSKGVVKTNKLLNAIFIFLILVLLGLIGYIIYTICIAGVLPL